jgi:hypothetical protein
MYPVALPEENGLSVGKRENEENILTEWKEVTRGFRKFHDVGSHNLFACFSPQKFRVIKSSKRKWAGQIESMEEKKDAIAYAKV